MSESKVSARLTEGLAEEVKNLIIQPRLQGFAKVFIALSDVNKAHLVMLAERGLINRHHAHQIASAVMEIEIEGASAIELDAAREDAYFNYEAHLMAKIGDDVGGRLHTGRSRNDVLATLDRMKCRQALLELIDALHALRDTALRQSVKHIHSIIPGYTHLQPAQPISYGFYLAGVAQALERDTARLNENLNGMNSCPLGAAAFAGTIYEIDRQRTAELLGFDDYVENALDAVASRDFMVATLADLSMLAIFWSRVAQDYFVWSTAEFGIIEFPDSVATTSSIMPQKKNPIVLEYLKGRAGNIIGGLLSATIAIKGTNFSHAGDANRESSASFSDAVDEAIRCIKLLELVLRTASPIEKVAMRLASRDFSTVTALADLIVVERNWPFRSAHHVVGAAVKDALEKGLGADAISAHMLDIAAQEQMGATLGFSEKQVEQCLDPVANVHARRSAGGPSPDDVEVRVAAAIERLDVEKSRHKIKKECLIERRHELNAEVKKLAAVGPS
ncbi:argininosuccinate lyase [Caballeronia sordidicola]|uniref:Argininosuccinate lyase n=1 Tax=Caballeronia sordidicola TaxID=196367 RepID=A0A158HPE2_CABSO|nr:argininosuccinate lyase [Caballeronia sordidicola]SAL46235.1 argininosuccinate lyase [Caballeronia sordidicola]